MEILSIDEAAKQGLSIPPAAPTPGEFIIVGTRNELNDLLGEHRRTAAYISMGKVHRFTAATHGLDSLRSLLERALKNRDRKNEAQGVEQSKTHGFRSVIRLAPGDPLNTNAKVVMFVLYEVKIVPAESWRATHYRSWDTDLVICDDLDHLNKLRDQQQALGKISIVY